MLAISSVVLLNTVFLGSFVAFISLISFNVFSLNCTVCLYNGLA